MKRLSAFSICLFIAALALCLCACGSSPSGGASASGDNAPAGTSAAEAESGGSDFADACVDEYGNISLYALTELDGPQLIALLEQQGYEWDDEQSAWIRSEDGAFFVAGDDDGKYALERYDDMSAQGGPIAFESNNAVAGYEDPQAALEGNAQCTIVDSFFDGSSGIVIFCGPSTTEYLGIVGPEAEGTMHVHIFSQEAVASGKLDELVGEELGTTFEEVWESATGKAAYGQ